MRPPKPSPSFFHCQLPGDVLFELTNFAFDIHHEVTLTYTALLSYFFAGHLEGNTPKFGVNIDGFSNPFDQGVANNWATSAAEAAIMACWNYGECFRWRPRFSAGRTAECSQLDETLQKHSEMFQRDFPKIGVLRHAIAHRVELKSKTQRNAFRGAITRNKNISMEKGAILFMSQCFEDDTYVVTRSGERLTFEMSSQNYMKLLAMYEKCMSDLAGH